MAVALAGPTVIAAALTISGILYTGTRPRTPTTTPTPVQAEVKAP
ncbi:hypothetical protein OG884_19420 [Streptosporangium sp. NBC_01755]|nr:MULTISPECIES: hypothetical protein [unclassified Streptosporangium]WSA24838.1 hypothetical protein OIE13_28475 [Streptosporangium sp. NBC_01810]WSD03979.1 hypothetical protein OG884_19420 [Streptosporangium sp. NBC_01755]